MILLTTWLHLGQGGSTGAMPEVEEVEVKAIVEAVEDPTGRKFKNLCLISLGA